MRKDILDPGPAVSGPDKEVGPGVAKQWNFEHGWPSKWVGSDQAVESDLLSDDILEVIARLDGGSVDGLLLPAAHKVAPAENMPLTFYKITDQDSRDALEQIADSFDDNVVFLNPGGQQSAGDVFVKVEWFRIDDHGQEASEAWSPLSDFSDSDTILF